MKNDRAGAWGGVRVQAHLMAGQLGAQLNGPWMLTTVVDYYVCRLAACNCDALVMKRRGTG